MHLNNNNSKILNHIQFLRAISVLLVFFYHLKIDYFSYGFLGVDIFFVISGFVISSIIFHEIQITKKFNFYNFYIKRFKRIYPVLIFILSFTFLLIIFFQPMDLFLNNLKVYFFSLIGVSNFYYLFLQKDYFDTVFDDPLAHTWSLGVEEQFYLIFPIFLYLLLKLKSDLKNILIFLILILVGVALTLNFQENIKLTFYSPIFRFWEFLFGALTLFLTKKMKFKNRYFSFLAFAILIVLIIKNNNINLPITIFITCFSTSIFILFYDRNEYSNYLFENKYFVFLGNISYSFYLWHLPLIYFYDLYFEKSLFRVPILFITIIILSCLSYFFIENKYRYLKFDFKINFQRLSLISVISIFSILVFFIASKDSYNNSVKNKLKETIYNLNYLENTINYTQRAVFYKISIGKNEIYRFCTKNANSPKLNEDNLRVNCMKKGLKNKRIFFIEGNSHTANFVPIFNHDSFIDTVYYNHTVYPLKNINIDLVNSLKKSYEEIVYVTNIRDEESLSRLINIEKKFDKNIKFLILGPIPNVPEKIEPLKCFIKNIDCEFNTEEDIRKRNLISLNSKINNLIKKNLKFDYFNPYNSICPFKVCKVFDKEKNLITHLDESHFTIEGALLLKKDFFRFYKKTYFNIK